METILVNKLPTRTWNRLGVNETALLWDEAGTVDGGTEMLSSDGRLELYRLLPGRGDTYADDRLTLADGASLKAAMGYLGRKQQVIDLNLAVDHVGRNTRSDIDVSGALSDSAKKVFRGTIDFKNGSAGSTGSEQETVLLLGDDVVNKTVPLILCAEENVEGTHGATIGALDDDTLFYFESRGFDRDAAERLMARAAVERLAHDLGDDATAETVQHELNGGM